MVVFSIFKPYHCGKESYISTMLNVLLSILFISIFVILIDFATKSFGIWRKTIFNASIIQLVLLAIIKKIECSLYPKIVPLKKTMIIGNSLKDASSLGMHIINSTNNQYKIEYLLSQDADNKFILGKNIDQIVVSVNCSQEIMRQVEAYCLDSGIDCMIVPSYSNILINSGKLQNIGDMPTINIKSCLDIENRIAKRAIDIVFSFILIVITLIPMLIIMLIIKLSDGSSPLYWQTRVTRKNKGFKLYKLRTMIIDAEKKTGAVLASANDQRITKLGKVLRASRLDELPQLFNVLKGEMSLVGPRPERPELIERITKTTPAFKYRTIVKAGLTGLAQTSGRYDTSFYNKLMYDLYYVSHYSFLLDIKILFATLQVLTTPSVTQGVNNVNKDDLTEMISEKGYIHLDDNCLAKSAIPPTKFK